MPIFDGLDELDPNSADLVLARTLIGALNLAARPGTWPFVVTCRAELYHQLVNVGVELQDTTVIRVKPSVSRSSEARLDLETLS
ncbi:hypothetical protein [Prauserella muralis]|uniref:hypothetical protein n=1 Tax=Prauserella muralis TaxID=588067 RepID=UPI0011BF5365|nr:hypothetical protein [Prauserella muralis]